MGWSGTILTSPDGIVLTLRKLSRETTFPIDGITFGRNIFVAFSQDMFDPPYYDYESTLLTSNDGISWTLKEIKFRRILKVIFN